MIELRSYGDLRRYAGEKVASDESVVLVTASEDDTVSDVLRRVGTDLDKVSNVFLNGKLLFSRSSMAPWLGYQREWVSPDFNPLDVQVHCGGRLGTFPRDMGMLVV